MKKDTISSIVKQDEGVLKIWNKFNNKYRRSKTNLALINGIIFILTAILVLLNLWTMLTLKKAPYDVAAWQWARNCFLAMAIITALTGLFTSTLTLFKFKSVSRQAKDAIKVIDAELKEYRSKNGRYAEIENKDQVFIEFITDAIFIEY